MGPSLPTWLHRAARSRGVPKSAAAEANPLPVSPREERGFRDDRPPRRAIVGPAATTGPAIRRPPREAAAPRRPAPRGASRGPRGRPPRRVRDDGPPPRRSWPPPRRTPPRRSSPRLRSGQAARRPRRRWSRSPRADPEREGSGGRGIPRRPPAAAFLEQLMEHLASPSRSWSNGETNRVNVVGTTTRSRALGALFAAGGGLSACSTSSTSCSPRQMGEWTSVCGRRGYRGRRESSFGSACGRRPGRGDGDDAPGGADAPPSSGVVHLALPGHTASDTSIGEEPNRSFVGSRARAEPDRAFSHVAPGPSGRGPGRCW